MVNANELRLGNRVNIRIEVPALQQSFSGGKVTKIAKNFVCVNDIKFPIKTLRPIPLTHEHLVNAGFEKVREYWHLDRFTIVDCGHGFFVNAPNNIPVYDVHTLQNLFFCLIRKELEIKL